MEISSIEIVMHLAVSLKLKRIKTKKLSTNKYGIILVECEGETFLREHFLMNLEFIKERKTCILLVHGFVS